MLPWKSIPALINKQLVFNPSVQFASDRAGRGIDLQTNGAAESDNLS
jgi:hypothetical protein